MPLPASSNAVRPPVVVTGASGFSARHLLPALAARGARGVAVSRRRFEFDLPSNWEALRVASYAELPLPKECVVVHLAESADSAAYDRDEELAARQLATLDRLLEQPATRFVYVSSGAVYGDDRSHPRRPDESVAPAGAYGRAKHQGEERVLRRAGGVVLRPGNLYGRGMASTTVVSELLVQLGHDGPLALRDGGPIRDFLDVTDYASGLAAAALGSTCGCFNLATGVGTSVRALARMILDAAGRTREAIVETEPSGRRSTLILDADATMAAFGWHAETQVADGMAKLVRERWPVARES